MTTQPTDNIRYTIGDPPGEVGYTETHAGTVATLTASGTYDTTPRTIRVLASDLAAQEREMAALREQVTALQTRCTKLVEEKRALDWTAHVAHLAVLFKQPQQDKPWFPDEAIVKLRRRLLEEEFRETMEALDELDFVEVVDGCIDTIVVAIGMLIAFGVDPRPMWAEVHATNVAKTNGPVSAEGKALKPAGWKPPRIAELLREQGWRG